MTKSNPEPEKETIVWGPLTFLTRLPHPLRFILVFLLGGTLIVAGILMLVFPGPGILTIALGLAVWGIEFEWAARALRTGQNAGSSAYQWGRGRFTKKGTANDN